MTEPVKDFMQEPSPHEEGVIDGPGTAISVVSAAEINQQIVTAKRFPRDPTQFRRKIFQMATIDIETAESCIYVVPRDGKMIDGPSIRFAELLLVAWGNHRTGAEVTSIDEEFVVAEGIFLDLETNGAIRAKIMRRIVGKPSKDFPKGKRYAVDGISNTGNAACSIAKRNAVLSGIPKALWKDIWDETKKVAGGSAQTFATRRDKIIKELGIQGATPDQIFRLLGVKGMEGIETEHLVHLRGLHNAIKDGETTIDEAFGQPIRPGEIVPKEPSRSDFAGADKAKPKAAEKVAEPEKTEAQKARDAETDGPAPEEEEAEQEAVMAEPNDRELARLDVIKDYYKSLAIQTTVPKIVALMEEGQGAGVMNDAELKEWTAACQKKYDETLDAAKKARKGK